jgi:hypothetical protein
VLDALDQEAQPFRAVHRLIDAIEVLVKLHTVLAVSRFAEAVGSGAPTLLPEVRRLLAEGLRTPSLGVWWVFARDTSRALAQAGLAEPAPGLFAALAKKKPLAMAFSDEQNLIAFRNGYAHGAAPDDANCVADLARVRPRLDALCADAWPLADAELFAVLPGGRALRLRGAAPEPFDAPAGCEAGHVYARRGEGVPLDLHPLLAWLPSPRGEGAFFYNDLRTKDAGALHYGLSLHTRSRALAEALLRRYPLDAWKAVETEDEAAIRERIAALAESFKGRAADLKAIVDHLGRRSRGFLVVWGAPGVGKSALLARALQYLEWSEESQRAAYPEIEPPRAPAVAIDDEHGGGDAISEGSEPGTFRDNAEAELGAAPAAEPLRLIVVRTFVRRADNLEVRDIFESLGRQLDRRFGLSVGGATNASEAAALLKERIRMSSWRLAEDQRLVIVIDGLDEAAEHAEFVRGLPREVPERVHVIYASRPQPILRSEVYEQLEMRTRAERELGGLSREDTRSLLYEHVDKYAMEARWAERVCARSEGNALYLRLLCDALDRQEVTVNEDARLPKNMAEQYDNVLRRVSRTPGASALLELLAAAHAFVPLSLATALLGLALPGWDDDRSRAAVEACAEVLCDDPATPEQDSQLFHESLREYLKERRGAAVRAWQDRLAEWSHAWRACAGHSSAELYALRWGATHLGEQLENARGAKDDDRAARLEDRLVAMVEDADWRKRTMRACGHAEPLRRGIHLAQTVAVARHKAAMTDATRERVARLAEWMWGEEVRLFEGQRALLKVAHATKRGWRDVHKLASAGTTAKDRALLVVLALWGDRGHRAQLPPEFGAAGLKEIRGWFGEAESTALDRLWRELAGGP